MLTSLELYGKETFLDQHRKELVDAATLNRSLHTSRLDRLNIQEKGKQVLPLVYRLSYVLVIALIITLLAAEVVTAVTGSAGGGSGINLVR